MRTAIIGLQFGDEGKGRVSGYFIKDYDWSIRFNGGPNAGHTVYDDDGKKHKFHHLPAGVIFGKKIALDAGMVINENELYREIKQLNTDIDLYISNNVHKICESHIKQDTEGSEIGSTKKGIAYVYADRALRKGLRFGGDKLCFDWEFTKDQIKWSTYRGLPPIEKNESALFEGAQGIMLDVDYGCYPYVTSSSVMPSMIHKIDKTIGVMKAYTSRVGDGPPYFPQEDWLADLGQEFGTTTGRRRKCYWNDMDQLEYALSIVQPNEIAVTKLDILENVKNICVWKDNKKIEIGNLDSYVSCLIKQFPQIKYLSYSPQGEMVKA